MVELGTTHEMRWTVSEEHLASTFGSGLVKVLATPVLVGFCEEACRTMIERDLPPGQKTVGVSVSLEHTAATPPGMTVTVRATLVKIAGRKRVFHVECQDNAEPIAHGSHTRFVIDSDRFEAGIAAKAAQIDCA
jgi:predicted thioesterase